MDFDSNHAPFLRSFCISALVTAATLLLVSWSTAPSQQLQSHPIPTTATAQVAAIPSATATMRGTSRRQAGALLLSTIGTALTAGPAAADQMMSSLAVPDKVPVWLGSGCFWGRQYDFVQLEKEVFGRTNAGVTALSGYAGGTKASRAGLNCYFGGPWGSLYELNGQAEVVQIMLDRDSLVDQFRAAIKVYFGQFIRLPTGQMIRQDPQDLGPAYRSVLGLPGGIASPLMDIVREENVNNMVLREGQGNDGDSLNVIWVMDTTKFPFYRAEKYHQFHKGLGRETFGPEYLEELKSVQDRLGRIDPTGCPEQTLFTS